MAASYVVQSRQNSNLQLAGIIDDFATLDMILRYNDVSEWTMTIDRKSAHVPNLVPLSNPLGANGNGIVVTRDFGTGPQVILSGPITHIDYRMSSQLMTLKGFDDTIWLKWRRADTVPSSYAYSTEVLADGASRFYRLGESSGATATDASGHLNGTYNGTIGYSQPGGIDDTNTAILFNGTNAYVSSGSTGLPTAANAPVTLEAWCYMTANPASARFLVCVGNRDVAGAFLNLNIQTSGAVQLSNGTVSVTSPTGLSLNIWHHVVGVFTGSLLFLYLDGQPLNAGSAASLTLAYSGATNFAIASQTSGSLGAVPGNFFPGTADEGAFYPSALSAARIQVHYNVGRSRLADVASDNRSGKASTTMIAYVNANAGPGTIAARQVANLTMAADPSIGGQVTGVARGDELLIIMQTLALQSGDNIGFKIQQSYLTGPNTLAFTTYAPRDQSSNAVFSDQIGNLLDYSYAVDYPAMNDIVFGGSGSSTARAFAEGQDSNSVSVYGRIEGFLNGPSSQDWQTLQNGISAELLAQSAQINLSITPVDTQGLMYQRDYGLGDKITVGVEGSLIQDKVREIKISLTKGSQGQPDEIITPALGQQGFAAAQDSLIAGALRGIFANIQRANKKIARIERNQ